MNYINFIQEKDLIIRIPVYALFGIYIFKYHKFPYFMDLYTKEKNATKLLIFFLGIHGIDILFNLRLVLRDDQANKE